MGTTILFNVVPLDSLLCSQSWHATRGQDQAPPPDPDLGLNSQTRALGLRLSPLLQNFLELFYLLAPGGSLVLDVHLWTCGEILLETPTSVLTPGWLLLLVSIPFRSHFLLLYLTSSRNLLCSASRSSTRSPLLLVSMRGCAVRCNTWGLRAKRKENHAYTGVFYAMLTNGREVQKYLRRNAKY